MKFTLATSVLAVSAVAVADTVYFSAVDPKTGNQLANIADLHSMAGGSFWFYSSDPSMYNFDPATNLVTKTIGTNPYQFGTSSIYAGTFAGVFMTNKKTPVTTDAKGKVTVYQFFACNSVNDPYKYSNTRSVIMANPVGNMTLPAASCQPVDIYKNTVPTQLANNGTWTSYTTYCPLPTVVTITSCGTAACYPTAVTVTTATTITCAQCIAPTGSVSSLVPPTSGAPVSTITYTGAAGKAAVGAGLVGAAAAMLL